MNKLIIMVLLIGSFLLGYRLAEFRYTEKKSAPAQTTSSSSGLVSRPMPRDLSSAPQQRALPLSTQVQQLFAQQRYQEAIDLLQLQIQANPTAVNAWQLLAEAYTAQNNYIKATEAKITAITVETDVIRRDELLAQVRDSLLAAARTPRLFSDDDIWLISQLELLLNHGGNDGEVHLLLASLYLKQEDTYAAQYHALMAANDAAVQKQAERLLTQLSGNRIPDQSIFPLVRLGNQFLIEVTIEGHPARLLLDTGAALSGLSTTYAARHPHIIKAQRPIRLNTAAGVTDTVLFTVNYLALGELRFDQHILALLPMEAAGFDGLLGIDILGRFDFVIDQSSLALHLKARHH